MLSMTVGFCCTSHENGIGPHAPSDPTPRAKSTAHNPPRSGRFTHNDMVFNLPLLTRAYALATKARDTLRSCLNLSRPPLSLLRLIIPHTLLGTIANVLPQKHINGLFRRYFQSVWRWRHRIFAGTLFAH